MLFVVTAMMSADVFLQQLTDAKKLLFNAPIDCRFDFLVHYTLHLGFECIPFILHAIRPKQADKSREEVPNQWYARGLCCNQCFGNITDCRGVGIIRGYKALPVEMRM